MKKIRILNLIPIIKTEALAPEDMEFRLKLHGILQEQTNGLVHLDSVYIDEGSSALECSYDIAISIPYIMEKARWAERHGYDALVLDCFVDPGIDECRELLDIPVLGACQSACSLAVRLAGRFLVLLPADSYERGFSNLLAKYGASGSGILSDPLNIPVLDLYNDRREVLERVVKISLDHIKRHRAGAVVLGCTCMSDLAEPISAALAEQGYPALVVDPLRAAVYDALACVLMGVSQSKLAYQLIWGKEVKSDFDII